MFVIEPAGLAGFMDYQVDEIVSGIIPLSDIPGPECISTQPDEAYKGFLVRARSHTMNIASGTDF